MLHVLSIISSQKDTGMVCYWLIPAVWKSQEIRGCKCSAAAGWKPALFRCNYADKQTSDDLIGSTSAEIQSAGLFNYALQIRGVLLASWVWTDEPARLTLPLSEAEAGGCSVGVLLQHPLGACRPTGGSRSPAEPPSRCPEAGPGQEGQQVAVPAGNSLLKQLPGRLLKATAAPGRGGGGRGLGPWGQEMSSRQPAGRAAGGLVSSSNRPGCSGEGRGRAGDGGSMPACPPGRGHGRPAQPRCSPSPS